MRIQIYKDILTNELALEDAKKKLQSEPVLENGEVFVTPNLVKSMLDKYLAGEVDDKQVSDWAAFLTSNDVYVTPGWEDDSRADRYEPMWGILQQLSTPFIDGSITKERAKRFIAQLHKLED